MLRPCPLNLNVDIPDYRCLGFVMYVVIWAVLAAFAAEQLSTSLSVKTDASTEVHFEPEVFWWSSSDTWERVSAGNYSCDVSYGDIGGHPMIHRAALLSLPVTIIGMKLLQFAASGISDGIHWVLCAMSWVFMIVSIMVVIVTSREVYENDRCTFRDYVSTSTQVMMILYIMMETVSFIAWTRIRFTKLTFHTCHGYVALEVLAWKGRWVYVKMKASRPTDVKVSFRMGFSYLNGLRETVGIRVRKADIVVLGSPSRLALLRVGLAAADATVHTARAAGSTWMDIV